MTKILIIDDEPSLRKLSQINLTASGYSVIVAENGEEGLKLAKSVHPDLILLDNKMPGMSGWDVLIALRADAKLKQTPVIIMTASLQEDGKVTSGKSAAGFLGKPFAVSELLIAVKKALGE